MRGYAIHDYEVPFDVSEYEDVFALNAFVQFITAYDYALVEVVCECLIDREEIIRILSSGDYSVYYDVDDLSDVAKQMVDEGLYDTAPASMASYIDYDKIELDLDAEGWLLQSSEEGRSTVP